MRLMAKHEEDILICRAATRLPFDPQIWKESDQSGDAALVSPAMNTTHPLGTKPTFRVALYLQRAGSLIAPCGDAYD